jgi:hypothetical protein
MTWTEIDLWPQNVHQPPTIIPMNVSRLLARGPGTGMYPRPTITTRLAWYYYSWQICELTKTELTDEGDWKKQWIWKRSKMKNENELKVTDCCCWVGLGQQVPLPGTDERRDKTTTCEKPSSLCCHQVCCLNIDPSTAVRGTVYLQLENRV